MRTRVLVGLLLFAGCHSLENRFVFHPRPIDARNDAPLPAPIEDVWLSTEGTKIHGRWWPSPNARGAILYLHGNAGNLDSFGRTVRDLRGSLDRSVLIVDYPGYGRSEGKPSEAGCYAAARSAYEWLVKNQAIPPERVVIVGESLGGGVAVELASGRPHEALVLIRTFTSVPAVAAKATGLSSAPALMFNRFDSLKKIGMCKSPIFIAQADKDRLIPFTHGEKLRDAAKAPMQFHVLRGLDHNDPLPAEFYQALREFLQAPP